MKISVKNLVKKFDEVTAVDDVSVEIQDGEFFFFLGPSGCGKTTMLRMISGFDKPSSGKIFFNDKDITNLEPSKRNIGMVFQNYALWPHLTVYKNVEYGVKLRNFSKQKRQEKVYNALKSVHMERYAERFPNQLSGGQQQRVALARALVIEPDVLLLDEPLSNLDAKLRQEMRDEIKRIQNTLRITTIYVTHDQKEALSMGDSIALMKDGKIVQRSAPRVMHREPKNSFVADFIGETNFVDAEVLEVNGKKAKLLLSDSNEKKIILNSDLAFNELKQGSKVILSIRPESIMFKENITESSAYNKLAINIIDKVYLGEAEQYSIKIDTIKLRLTQLNPFIDRQILETDFVYIHPKDVIILEN